MPFRALVILLAATLVLAGCTSSAPSGQATAAYQIALETQPSPMQSGRLSTVMLRVTDASGQPLRGANVSFKG